jgi:Tol biopolymer transport system component
MTLSPGTRLGAYEIAALIGAGGMGEVYRARDTRLNRDVALKVLPEVFAADPDRLARFKREAQLLASLNHPHIAVIHGLEDSLSTGSGQAVQALVLELVDGETLADRIARSPIPLDEALPIAKQIAEALEAAHEQGIIHRDLKPSNVKVTADGAVKVLDFGLAKLTDTAGVMSGVSRPEVTASPTITSPAMMTGMGTIIGTAAYMAPEQAKGRPADKRSDVWAFGCVLYEMLAGKRAFEGEDVSDTLAAVLRGEPDWSALPRELPASITAVLRASLQRDRKKRPADAAAVTFVLDHASELAPTAAPHAAASKERRPRLLAVAGVAAVAAAAVTLIAMRLLTPAPQNMEVTRFLIDPPPGGAFTGSNLIPRFAVSPDGRSVAFEAGPSGGPFMLWVRRLDSVDAQPLRLTEVAQNNSIQGLFWFADGRTIGFFDESNGKLKKVDAQTGAIQTLAGVTSNQFAGSANADGTIIYSSAATKGIIKVSSTGGSPAQVTTVDSTRQELMHLWPWFLPDGRHFLYLSAPADRREWAIFVGSLDSAERRLLVHADSMAEFAPPDQLLYVQGDTLFTHTMDMGGLQLVGEPVLVTQPTFVTPQGRAGFSVSNTGVLVHATGPGLLGGGGAIRSLTWVSRDGKEESIGAPDRSYVYPRISPDGTRVALDTRDADNDIWVWHFVRQTLTRLTFSPEFDRFPVWTVDSRRVLFSSGSGADQNLFAVAADGTGTPERLTNSPNAPAPTSTSPDGAQVVFHENAGMGTQLNLVELGGSHRVEPLAHSRPGTKRNGMISPDGRWIAYESDESGRFEIYVRPYPDVQAGRWQVSTDGGVRPVWNPNSRELFYASTDNSLMLVRVEAAQSWLGSTPERLFSNPNLSSPAGLAGLSYDISPDGRRFLILKLKSSQETTSDPVQLLVVQNWHEEVKRLVPAN